MLINVYFGFIMTSVTVTVGKVPSTATYHYQINTDLQQIAAQEEKIRTEGSPTPKIAITGKKLEPSLSKSVHVIDCNKTRSPRCGLWTKGKELALFNQLEIDLWFVTKLAPCVSQWEVKGAKRDQKADEEEEKHRNLRQGRE